MSFSSNQPLLINQLPVSVEIPTDVDITQILSLIYKRIAFAVNTKTGSLYDLVEQGNFQNFFTPNVPFQYRPAYRYTFDLVALNGANIPALAVVTFPHGIIGVQFATLVYVSCTSVAGDFFTVVFPQATATTTNINFTNPIATALNSAVYVFEYLKN